jgi:gluconate 5-dehydrogenase
MTNFDLTGRIALVTGSGQGIGLALATALAEAGAQIVLNGRDAAKLDRAAATLAATGATIHTAAFDVTSAPAVTAGVARIEDEVGPIDILVNNAGNTVKKPYLESNLAEFDGVLDVHLRGPIELTRHVARRQLERGSGNIIFMASMTSFIGQPLVHGYTTAKSAILGVVRALSAELAGGGIRVNGVAPGWIDTPLFRGATSNDPERLRKILGRIQMQRVGLPEEIGWACVFLASAAASYVTGQTLVVDGGGLVGF